MKNQLLIFLFSLIALSSHAQRSTIDEKVDSLLSLMTLDEKIGQMTQAERGMLEEVSDIAYYKLGSLLSGGGSAPTPNTRAAWANMYDQFQSQALQTRLGIPIIYGVDAVHGHNNVYGAVIMPHNIGLGCSWDAELVKAVQQITAKEVAATGIDWTFAPCIAVARNERWGRTYEGFGETPEIQKIMAAASIEGLQGDGLEHPETILACAKHFVGDGGTQNGTDQGNTIISEQELREIHMAGYIDAIEAHVGSVMASYNSWNGQKLHGHDYLLTEVLKDELGFEGFVISDWAGVDQINEDYREAVKRAINAGIDMVMVPDRYIFFISILKDLVQSNEVSMDRIDDAVRRILKQKFLLNLFEMPLTDPSLAASFGSDTHRAVAREAVNASMVVLAAKNDVLPLQKNNQKILVAGSLARNLGGQCGGWTISWQGAEGNTTVGTDILTGIQQMAESSEVVYSLNGSLTESVDVAVVVIGETPYAEGAGDRSSLDIGAQDVNLIKHLKEQGIPVVTILVSGRPMIFGELLSYTDALIAAWLPGTEGDGVADILFGAVPPSGKLTHSWPRSMDQIPLNTGDADYQPLYPYKHGIQQLPAAANSAALLPYGAGSNREGNIIWLALSDDVSTLNYENNDFEIKINNQTVPGLISEVGLSDFDASMLMLTLNTPINEVGHQLSISFTGEGIASSDLLLDHFTDFFVHNAYNGMNETNEIPGKIQAENYFDMSGIETEVCTDIGGGLNVGYIEAGDWMKYTVEVKQTGLFRLNSRISGYEGGILKITFNDTIIANVSYASTNGWQNWKDFDTEIELKQGTYTMQVLAQSNAFNINYFDFELLNGLHDNRQLIHSISVYPNPATTQLNIDFSSANATQISMKLYSSSGKLAQAFYSGGAGAGNNTYRFSLDTNLRSGLYFVEIKDHSRRYISKLMKE